MVRVIVADDSHLVRAGLVALVSQWPDVDVVGEAADGRVALDGVREHRPDVLVSQAALPGITGIGLATRIADEGLGARVVIIAREADELLLRQAVQCGVRGYLLTSAAPGELQVAIAAAARGEVYLTPSVGTIAADLLHDGAGDPPHLQRLSRRERQVMRLIAEGHTNSAVARELSISVKTVEKHRASLMHKLEAHHVADVVRLAIRHGVVPLET